MGLGSYSAVFSLALTVCSLSLGSEDNTRVAWLDSSGEPLQSHRDCLTFSRPPHAKARADEDLARFRLRLDGFGLRPSVRMSLVSVDARTKIERDRLEVGLIEPSATGIRFSPWLVLVSDFLDKISLGPSNRAIVARPGDFVEARVRVGGARSMVWTMPVGRPEEELGPYSIRKIGLRFTVLRQFPNGPPLVEGDNGGVRAIIEHQVDILNEVLAQCFIEATVAEYAAVFVENPPGPCLLAVGDRMGLPSAGGEVRLEVDGVQHGPWKVGKGYRPAETARLISHYLNRIGYVTDVSINKKLPSFAFETADLIVKRADGTLAELDSWPGEPIFSDPTQSMEIGSVTLDDGIDAFDENLAELGTLEERTLVKALKDSSWTTIDVFIINYFERGEKQGESFIRASGSSLRNAVLINLDALTRARHSYTLPHEIGHILLDDLGHPDARGITRTDLLMHSSSSSAMNGPKRLTTEECAKMRRVSSYMFK